MRFINILTIALFIFIVIPRVFSNCTTINEHIFVCYNHCIENSICKLDFHINGTSTAYLVPTNSDYYILTNNITSFGNTKGVMITKNQSTVDIVPKKNITKIASIFSESKIMPTIIINATIKPTQNIINTSNSTQETKKDNNPNKLLFINLAYIFFVCAFIIFLLISQLRINTLEKNHKKEIESIIKDIENKIIEETKKEEEPLNEPDKNNLIVNGLKFKDETPIIKNKESTIIKKVLIEAKLKGIPKEVVYSHLLNHYSKDKIDEFIKRYYI